MDKQKIFSLNISLLNVRLVCLLVALVNLLVVAVATLNIDFTVDDDPKVRAYAHMKWQLFTVWYNLVNLAYIPARLYCDWKTYKGEGNNPLVKHLLHASDVVFTGILFPIVLFGDVTFWYLFTTDQTLVSPPRVFEYIPYWVQHSFHTVPFFQVLLDLALTPRRRPKSLMPRLSLLLLFTFTYIWIIVNNYVNGIMLYGLFEGKSGLQMFAMGVPQFISLLLLFAVQWPAIDYLWGIRPLKKIS